MCIRDRQKPPALRGRQARSWASGFLLVIIVRHACSSGGAPGRPFGPGRRAAGTPTYTAWGRGGPRVSWRP
eukprot:9901025-Alexandrium_andersonii.AAC.1